MSGKKKKRDLNKTPKNLDFFHLFFSAGGDGDLVKKMGGMGVATFWYSLKSVFLSHWLCYTMKYGI